MLIAALKREGVETVDLGIATDEQDILEEAMFGRMNEWDFLITSGGVSMGDKDFIKPILERKGTIHIGRVLMKPGKPLTFATIPTESGTKFVFGLPGNPVSSMVTFYLFVVPASRSWQGKEGKLDKVSVTIQNDLKLDITRPEYHRVSLTFEDGVYKATTTGNQISSRLLSMVSADALLILPQGKEKGDSIPKHSVVNAYLL